MRYYISIIMLLFFISCKQKDHWGKYVVNDNIALDNYWRRVTGYDSLQITSNYEGDKLSYNFCYPNKWEFVKFKKDTAFVHDTVVVYDIPKIKRKYIGYRGFGLKHDVRDHPSGTFIYTPPDTIYVEKQLYTDTSFKTIYNSDSAERIKVNFKK